MNKADLKELVKTYFQLEDKNTTSEEIAKETFAGAKLIDGTEISTEGEGGFAVGQIAHVITDEGEKVLAPSGEHELEDGTVLVIDGEGAITGLKTKDGEAEGSLMADEAEEVAMADHDEAEITVGDEPEALEEEGIDVREAIIEAIMEEVAPAIEELKAKFAELEEKMKEHYSATPASESTIDTKLAAGEKFSNAANWKPNFDVAKGNKKKQYEAVLKNLSK